MIYAKYSLPYMQKILVEHYGFKLKMAKQQNHYQLLDEYFEPVKKIENQELKKELDRIGVIFMFTLGSYGFRV